MTMEEWEEEQPACEVWPEHEQAYQLFSALDTQWRVGMNGRSGLDYNVLYADIGRLGVTPERHTELRDEVKAIEISALNTMHAEQ